MKIGNKFYFQLETKCADILQAFSTLYKTPPLMVPSTAIQQSLIQIPPLNVEPDSKSSSPTSSTTNLTTTTAEVVASSPPKIVFNRKRTFLERNGKQKGRNQEQLK